MSHMMIKEPGIQRYNFFYFYLHQCFFCCGKPGSRDAWRLRPVFELEMGPDPTRAYF